MRFVGIGTCTIIALLSACDDRDRVITADCVKQNAGTYEQCHCATKTIKEATNEKAFDLIAKITADRSATDTAINKLSMSEKADMSSQINGANRIANQKCGTKH